jgi:FtsP/CotA-like multicopper oxidase with cupredoxin domain
MDGQWFKTYERNYSTNQIAGTLIIRRFAMSKKMLFMASVICLFGSAAAAVNLFSDGFESGNFAAGGWSTRNNDATVRSRAALTGNYGAQLARTTWMEKPISTVGYTDIHVKYYRATNRFDAGEFLYVEWYDGAVWNPLETIQSASYGDGLQDKLCGVGANENAGFRIRFRTNANRANEYAFIDDVVVSGTSTVVDTDPPTPDPATFASPPAPVSDTEITMTATTGSDASPPVEYYFAETSANPGGSDSGWTTSPVYNDTGLEAATQYIYTVQMRDSLGNTGTALAPASATTGGTKKGAEYFLRADTTTKIMPDGRVITMWGFALDSAFGAKDGQVTVPGPLLAVPDAFKNLIIHMDNDLPVPVSIIIPGQTNTIMTPVKFTDDRGRQRMRSFTHETEPNNIAPVVYEWKNLRSGTYLYHSGTHPAVQVQMGLYGCLTKNEGKVQGQEVPKVAYKKGNTYVIYDAEVVLCFSEIDPALHEAVADGNYGPEKPVTSTMSYKPEYFLINGRAYSPGLLPLPAGSPNDRVLLRFVNAGLETHVPVLQDLYMTVVAEDGYPYKYTKEQYSLILQALKTKDAIIVPAAGTYPVYDRRLRLTNAGTSPGGMLTFLEVAANEAAAKGPKKR